MRETREGIVSARKIYLSRKTSPEDAGKSDTAILYVMLCTLGNEFTEVVLFLSILVEFNVMCFSSRAWISNYLMQGMRLVGRSYCPRKIPIPCPMPTLTSYETHDSSTRLLVRSSSIELFVIC